MKISAVRIGLVVLAVVAVIGATVLFSGGNEAIGEIGPSPASADASGATDEGVAAAVTGNNEFAFNLYRQLAQR